jgi:hypothetical protein
MKKSGSDYENGSDEPLTDDNDEDEDAGSVDNIFEDLLKEQTVYAYPCMDDFNHIIDECEGKSRNHLAIIRSERSIYRQYKCKEHVNCSFEVIIGRRRGDGMFAVKKLLGKHSGERRDTLARGGRLWKKRRAGKLDNMIVQVLRTKQQKPTPADVVKTAATHMGEVVPYMSAYRALNSDTRDPRLIGRSMPKKTAQRLCRKYRRSYKYNGMLQPPYLSLSYKLDAAILKWLKCAAFRKKSLKETTG